MARYRRFVKLDDPHYPFEDKTAVSAAMAFVERFKPEVVFIGGDWVDFYRISRFQKSPAGHSLQEELDSAKAGLERLRSIVGYRTEIIYIRGNHEHRLIKYMRAKAEDLESLRDLTIPQQLRLRSLSIKYSETPVVKNGIIFGHGGIVRKFGGYSATGELLKAWSSGATGHTHRLAQVHFTAGNGNTYVWIEGGCLCKMDQEYMDGDIPNWQHGIVYGELGPHPYITLSPINGGRVRAFI